MFAKRPTVGFSLVPDPNRPWLPYGQFVAARRERASRHGINSPSNYCPPPSNATEPELRLRGPLAYSPGGVKIKALFPHRNRGAPPERAYT